MFAWLKHCWNRDWRSNSFVAWVVVALIVYNYYAILIAFVHNYKNTLIAARYTPLAHISSSNNNNNNINEATINSSYQSVNENVGGGENEQENENESEANNQSEDELKSIDQLADESNNTSSSSTLPPRANAEPYERANAVLYVLIRNNELATWLDTMYLFELNFNVGRNYPYLFVNDEPFNVTFKARVRSLTNATCKFVQVPTEYWTVPEWIDRQRMNASMRGWLSKVFRGTMMSYHHMCRFYSGFFFRLKATLKYDYFWRLEPATRFFCPIHVDPFKYMAETGKLYGFTIIRPELRRTIPSLWTTVMNWYNSRGRLNASASTLAANSLAYISNDEGITMNDKGCTFFNNFEIAAFSVFRDPLYVDFFDYLDKSGGFYYERWGDSAVNSLYLYLMVDHSRLHYFDDIAYYHHPYNNCPAKVSARCPRCVLKVPPKEKLKKKYERVSSECLKKWLKFSNKTISTHM